MDGATLAEVMTVPGVKSRVTRPQYDALAGPFTEALRMAQCTTVNRVAMFCAQVGHESSGLYYREEIWGPTAQQLRYDPDSGSSLARDLGNTQSGDGFRYKGRGAIQLTGRNNYGAFSRWCFAAKLVPSSDYFVRNPALVAEPVWGLTAAAWYWTVARARLNPLSDAGDIVAATKLVNGGVKGLADRTARWTRARAMGARLLTGGDQLSEAYERDSRARWGREDLLERDLRGDLSNKGKQLDRIEAALRALGDRVARLEQKP